MITAKELKGRWLISVQEGAKIGTIKEVFLSSDGLTLEGVLVGKTGILRRKSWLVQREGVELFGKDVWLVTHEKIAVDLVKVNEEKQLVSVNDIRGREITTTEGLPVGMILDVIFDDLMKIVGFRVGKVDKDGPLAKSKAISRSSVTAFGSREEPMVIDLDKAVLPTNFD